MTKSTRNDMNIAVGPPANLNERVLAKLMDAQHGSQKAETIRLVNLSGIENPSRKNFITFAKLAVAASLLAAVVGITLLGILGGNTSLFAQVAARLEALKSLVCRVQFVDENALARRYTATW